jgi:hypothetical protein
MPWVLLAIWSTWLHALQGLALQQAPLAPWVPDVGLVLLLALCSRLERRDLPRVALVVALGRVAVSVEPVPALLASCLGVVIVVAGLRSMVELGDPLARTLLALVAALAIARWHTLVASTRALQDASLYAESLAASWTAVRGALGPHALTRAAATALVALAFGPALAHLPGLTPLRRKRTWHAAASARSW